MDIEKNSTEISNEISSTLRLMKKAKTADDKLKYSIAIKNLCTSLDVFLNFFETMSSLDHFDEEDEELGGPIPF